MNVVAIAAHPDDAELSCAGTLLVSKSRGSFTAIVDLTKGELGTRGTPEIRSAESQAASKILGIVHRIQLTLPDGHLQNTPDQRKEVIMAIRALKPDIVLCNANTDRHPDHGMAAALIEDACFLAGLRNIETHYQEKKQEIHRPKIVLHYIQDRLLKPDVVIDITDQMETKMEAVRAFKSQFYDPESTEPNTYISSPDFMEGIMSRAREMGRMIGVKYGEGFTCRRPIGLSNLSVLL